ncbi:MAG: uncharacterized protein PWP03_49 [Candidatus Woesearchaeota archaeon]|nr:uncharacterized protein [Candidatus Woesearchaeota archaeon]MDN5327411.1 uncharacterized protein [Candidatus Woesearchaeota archaeon]
MAKNEELEEVISLIKELSEDFSVPRNVKKNLMVIEEILRDESKELSLRVDKAVSILDEVSEDPNIQMFTRTQIWSLVSMLSKL